MGDLVPWRDMIAAPEGWSSVLDDGRGELVELTRRQTLAVFAAVELDRVHSLDDVRVALRGKGFWRRLMAGAVGLRVEDAPGDMLVRDVLARLGVTRVEWVMPGDEDVAREEAREMIARLRETREEATCARSTSSSQARRAAPARWAPRS